MSKRLTHAVREMRQHLECNTDWDDVSGPPDDEDALEAIEQECGRMPGGGCMLAGTEHCDFDCPFS